MPRINKWRKLYVVQGAYGSGWEDVYSTWRWKDARDRLREYNDNDPQYPHRRITRLVINPEWAEDREFLCPACKSWKLNPILDGRKFKCDDCNEEFWSSSIN